MLTPLRVMLGIWPPWENCPFTLVGLSASETSPSPRSVWPRPSMSGRTTDELSHPAVDWPFHPESSSAQVPTPEPGLPPGLKVGGRLPGRQHLPVPRHMDAWLSASSVEANS